MLNMNNLRKFNSLILAFGIFYLIQNYTIGQLNFLKNIYILKPILLKEIIFLLSSLIICLILFDLPYKKHNI